ncbi:hypothetical protein JXB12_01370 [candidate division KSB1 bacterium]|nr:hypothetical protein [candidate division KSB1 bacterium]
MSDMSEKAVPGQVVKNEIDEIRDIIIGDYRKKFESEIEECRKENEHLRSEIKTLKLRLEKLDSLLSTNVEELNRAFNESKLLNESIETMKQDFLSQVSRLNDRKLDKTEIGQAFIEWGTRVKDAKS